MEDSPKTPALRMWPVAVILLVQLTTLILTVTDSIQNRVRFLFMMGGPLICLALFLIWWLLASRAGWREKFLMLLIAGLLIAGLGVAVHPKMRVVMWIYGVPLGLLAVSLAAWQGRAAASRKRLLLAGLFLVLCWGWMPLVRIAGFDGAYFPELTWRWAPTQAQALADRADSMTAREPADSAVEGESADERPPEWPTFRGPQGNSRVSELQLGTDWSDVAELWRIDIGPGWSSFAVDGQRLYTQEQRGEFELTVCYDIEDGTELWRYAVASQFDEVVSGTGPRATPTIVGDQVLSYGARGILTSLEASTGQLRWQHDLLRDFNGKLPMWGYSGSPSVYEDLCIAYAGGPGEDGLIAFALEDGSVRWKQPAGGMNFSTPLICRLGDSDQLLFQTSEGLIAMQPGSGRELWRIVPDNWKGPAMVQPQKIGEQSLIVPLGDGIGIARVEVTQADDTFEATQIWNSRHLKPSFNDFVYHQGFLYGFDQNIFACVDAETGQRQWKRGRYGFGQVLLIEDSGHLLILAESGELVILEATPDAHREIARLDALDDKTWNHPVIAGQRLFVRNGREAICYALPVVAVRN